MTSETREVLAELREKRALRSSKEHLSDYIRTYAFMMIYAVMAYAADTQKASGRLTLYFAIMAVVLIAIADSRKSIERRIERLIDRLEKKGSI